MTRRGTRGRAGITLTEILISIMIMGVGLISLATLFPLGLMRLRNASRMSRSALLADSAAAELATRNLLARSSFLRPASTHYGPPNFTAFGAPYAAKGFDPWIQDTPLPVTGPVGVYRGWGGFGDPLDFNADGVPEQPLINGPGLPVAYDPLWRSQTAAYPSATSEYRFATGIGTIRDDPNGVSSAVASAHGLQRLTNFPATATAVPSIFVSPDDIVFQSSEFQTDAGQNPTGARSAGSASPIVPDMGNDGVPVQDWRYSWMFTGRRTNAAYGTAYEGDIVVFDSRPLAIDPTTVAGRGVAAGETVVEAVFGYSKSVVRLGTLPYGYGGRAADRTVLLRWRADTPDPDVKVGSWIADVTYERSQAEDARWRDLYPGQRCHWYQVVKKTPAELNPDLQFADDPAGVDYRSMVVEVNVPLRAKTPLVWAAGARRGQPFHVNAALVSPYVINVFPKSFTAR